MTGDQSILAAMAIGCSTAAEIAGQLGRPLYEMTSALNRMTAEGRLKRISVGGAVRYLPDREGELRAKIERMKGWTPAALRAMRGEQ